MTGETAKTLAVATAIRPWSRTSHIVTWLTRDAGRIVTLVKGAVRPKSMFLGQYDLFYTCALVYYTRQRAGMWIPREAWPENRRDGLRGRWRETSLAAYAAEFAAELAPPDASSAEWFDMLSRFLDSLAERAAPMSPEESLASLARFEIDALSLAGLAPYFRNAKPGESVDFSIEGGRPGSGPRTVKVPPGAIGFLAGKCRAAPPAAVRDALRFLGAFLAWHLERPPAPRRTLIDLLSGDPQPSSPGP